MTISPKLRRRALLGAAGVCLPLPFLEFLQPKKAQAQAAAPQRFVVVYAPGGCVPDQWNPAGMGETDFVLPPVLAALEPFRSRLFIPQNLAFKVAEISQGNAHSVGSGAMLTGQILQGNDGFADGPSVDQVVAKTIGTGTKFASREFAVRWPTGGGGSGSSLNIINYSGPGQPVPPSVDPSKVFSDIFSGLSSTPAPSGPDPAEILRAQRRSVLDMVIGEFTTFNTGLAAGDKARLDAHLENVRKLETSLGTVAGATSCTVPMAPASIKAADDNQPQMAQIMTNLLVMALACDQTRVASLVFADSIAFHHFPFLGFTENYHAYQHDKGYQPDACAVIEKWHTDRVVDLLKGLDAIHEGAGTLLDNTILLSCSEISQPEEHGTTGMPFFMVGGGNKLRGGRRILCQDVPHNKLLLAIANSFGVTSTTFGHPDYQGGGALAGVFG